MNLRPFSTNEVCFNTRNQSNKVINCLKQLQWLPLPLLETTLPLAIEIKDKDTLYKVGKMESGCPVS